jgi:hypothetical protein
MTGAPPCVGCGYCCISVPCVYSLARYGLEDCPALQWAGNRYRCEHAEELAHELEIGAGCSSSLNSWRRNVKCRDKERREARPVGECTVESATQYRAQFAQFWPELGRYLAAVAQKGKHNDSKRP